MMPLAKPNDDFQSHPSIVEARRVLEAEAAAILGLIPHLNETFVAVTEAFFHCAGRVVTIGIGKSGIIARKISATLASTGTPAFFLHPADAIHGDLGMLVKGDIAVAISNSGETEEVLRLLPTIKRIGASIVSITGRPDSTLARNSDFHLSAEISAEACPLGLAPTASTTATLALGDALAMAVAVRRGFKEEHFASFHPGGKLGKRFLTVADLMHKGEQVPVVHLNAPMREVIYEMSRKGFGVTLVTEAATGLVQGIISDGDLRRLLEKEDAILTHTAAECMKSSPLMIASDELASAALQLMEERKVTSLIVGQRDQPVEGIIHLHDLWGLQLF
ncbi:MAG TPA: KpsF/GutQ family sugar-phosphate isomerase [Thermoanaerobaculia bacterium]|nr:KpsF/GutQ family sugar-phosphate isomerase [Thermoanaerobaculia bacterium]